MRKIPVWNNCVSLVACYWVPMNLAFWWVTCLYRSDSVVAPGGQSRSDYAVLPSISTINRWRLRNFNQF